MPDTKQTPTPDNTPDNTPLPGGGSWRWSTDAAGWVPSDIADAAASAAQPAQPAAQPAAAALTKPLKSQE